MNTFYLGTHVPSWLAHPSCEGVPLFVSARRLRDRRSPWPRAVTRWALDSGGFSELSMYGAWQTSPKQYIAEVRRWSAEIGGMDWAAIQDWMCEPFICAKTGKSVRQHQLYTVNNFLVLCMAAPEIPWAPVVQGFTLDDYLRCLDLYDLAGFDLSRETAVGVGSVCRRQGTLEAAQIFARLKRELPAARFHGFGVKTEGLPLYGDLLESADSLAWSMAARRMGRPLPECQERAAREGKAPHINCANCMTFALKWRDDLLRGLALKPQRPHQLHLFAA